MAGIYVHIPFCRKACTYCDFHFSTSLALKDRIIDAMMTEIRLRQDFFGAAEQLETLYFGGGTPSVLNPGDLEKLIEEIRETFSFSAAPEITLEANPDDLSRDYLTRLRDLGINRLSIGVQSFRQADMVLMNRSHSVEQAAASLDEARGVGFENITLDLIYGIPGLSLREWEENLKRAVETGIQHISAYALTVEPRTVLSRQVKKGEVALPDEDDFTRQFDFMIDFLKSEGFEHYELSNFARPGFRSRHNSAYWAGAPYLGLGPSAHSFKPWQRSWNIRNNARYARALEAGGLPVENKEKLSLADRANERIMTGLRRIPGISLRDFEAEFGFSLQRRETTVLQQLQDQGLVVLDGDNLRLTRKGLMVSDHVIAELFQVD